MLDNREPKPGAAGRSSAIAPVEPLEKPRKLFLLDAPTVVTHLEDARAKLREFPVRVPSAVSVMVNAGVVPDGTPDSFAALAGRCAVFRLEKV